MMKPDTTPPNHPATAGPTELIGVHGEADKTLPLENYQVKWAERLGLEQPKPDSSKPLSGQRWFRKKP